MWMIQYKHKDVKHFFVHIKQTTMICDYAFRGVIKNGKEKI